MHWRTRPQHPVERAESAASRPSTRIRLGTRASFPVRGKGVEQALVRSLGAWEESPFRAASRPWCRAGIIPAWRHLGRGCSSADSRIVRRGGRRANSRPAIQFKFVKGCAPLGRTGKAAGMRAEGSATRSGEFSAKDVSRQSTGMPASRTARCLQRIARSDRRARIPIERLAVSHQRRVFRSSSAHGPGGR